ncbi:metal ABC transporter solute-binding protein, Zn/Mn family [Galbitalea soli]|uniref:Zinc ABC transporter solute-binding protein n=1 Tax=Galbitalea soli TaxID=1268042 RepID=A0A7C9PNZ0_9MICO|nr:zinc ABC transporter substrate-binding protein [Galbitalea soli]NEM91791.1 zinc ABC transporter solute-binding protein [Galbitalea soli]NYJ29376.1 zinc/manganese transport system substrate-binding protein [Galbitalea soli]
MSPFPRLRARSRVLPATFAAVLLASALAGCSSSAAPPDTRIPVVASTNVYGDIAMAIGGSAVRVDSIIADPSQDPHSYEADARVQLALSRATLVIENGGGYDDFVDTLLRGAANTQATVLNAADISGYDQHPAGGDFNEHLWYDFPTVAKVAARISAELTRIDPSRASSFATRLAAFDAKLATLRAAEAAVAATARGTGVAITEPVPLYMLEAMGLVDRTPEGFSAAIEQGTDVSPALLRQTLALFSGHRVALLAYNAQTSSVETDAVTRAAKAAGIPVIAVYETVPAGVDYLGWMTRMVDQIAKAVQ